VRFTVTTLASCAWYAFEADSSPIAVFINFGTSNQRMVGTQTLSVQVNSNSTATDLHGHMRISTTPSGVEVAGFDVTVARSTG
jgi:hypothetical protein